MIFAAAIAFAVSVLSANNPKDLRTSEVASVVVHVVDAVREKNEDAILKYVSEGGISCVDDTIPKSQVAADLKDKESWLYTYLFDGQAFSKKFANQMYPNSISEVVSKSSRIESEIRFTKVKKVEDLSWACVRLKSEKHAFWPELCFSRKDTGWYLTSSPYNCE